MIDHGPYRIPSTSVLIAFESAARLGNFSRAARELQTSQSAVSRHIAKLEEQLSARLFERSRIGVSLTDAGRRYLEAVHVGLRALHAGAAEAAALAGADPSAVAVACTDELSRLFAMQRFDALKAALGEEARIRVLAHADAQAPAPPEPAADVILAWDAENTVSARCVVIAREAIGAFCSPGYAAAHSDVLGGPVVGWSDLTFLELGGSDESGATWARWFEAVGRPASRPRYEAVEGHAHALEAAIAGRGIVLGLRHLIGRHVEAGTLVMLTGGFVETGRRFYAALTAKGRQRPLARACMAFFGGASKHRTGGWDEPRSSQSRGGE